MVAVMLLDKTASFAATHDKQRMKDPSVLRQRAKVELLSDPQIDAVSVCLPNVLHAPITLAALRAGKHVICEKPPAMNAKEASRIARAAERAKKIVMYSVQRRFGGAELAAKLAIEKGHIGKPYHARRVDAHARNSHWHRLVHRQIQVRQGADRHRRAHARSRLAPARPPKPASVFATHQKFQSTVPKGITFDVDDAHLPRAIDGSATMELATSWALNQPPQQQGGVVRIFGDEGVMPIRRKRAIVSKPTPGEAKATPPAAEGCFACRADAPFRECILGRHANCRCRRACT
jgi:predicted dehydrogenase